MRSALRATCSCWSGRTPSWERGDLRPRLSGGAKVSGTARTTLSADLKEMAPGNDWLTVSSVCLGFSGTGWSPVACAPFYFIILFILKTCCFHPVNVWHKNKMSQSHHVSADHWNSWCGLRRPSVCHLVEFRANWNQTARLLRTGTRGRLKPGCVRGVRFKTRRWRCDSRRIGRPGCWQMSCDSKGDPGGARGILSEWLRWNNRLGNICGPQIQIPSDLLLVSQRYTLNLKHFIQSGASSLLVTLKATESDRSDVSLLHRLQHLFVLLSIRPNSLRDSQLDLCLQTSWESKSDSSSSLVCCSAEETRRNVVFWFSSSLCCSVTRK